MRKIIIASLLLTCAQFSFAQAPEIARPAAPMVQTPSAPFNGTMADTTAMPSVTSANGVKLTPKRQEMQEILSGFQECLQKAKTDAQLDACKQKFTLKKGK